jgi:GNAT superfamily N-acetyltransferase
MVMCTEHACYERSEFDPHGKAALLERALFDPNPRLAAWIAELGGHRVGYVTVTSDFSTWRARPFLHMDCLFVREGHRSAGIGAALLAAAVRFTAEQGHGELQWQTPDWNEAAARFYRRYGATGVPKLRFTLAIG